MNYFTEENQLTKQLFDLDEILEFQLNNDIQIIRGSDFQYECWINQKCYATSLTTLGSLVIGIKQFKKHENSQPK